MSARDHRRWLFFILLAGTALRIAFAVAFFRHPVGDIVPLDSEPYRALAQAIAAGRFDDPTFEYLNPPYGFVLAPFAAWPPGSARAATVTVQVLMDAAVIALTYFLASQVLPRAAALGAAALYAWYGTAVFYSATILPVTVSVLTLTLALAALLFAHGRRGLWWLLAGAAFGLFLLARPNGLALVPVIAWWMWMRGAPRARIALLALGTTLTLLPFSLRSLRLGGGPSPFPVNGGINFYIGNGPEAHGRYTHVPNVADRPGEQVRTSIAEASRRAGRALDAREASSFWFREGSRWMAREPGAALKLTLQKAGTFFRAEEPPLNIGYAFARKQIGVLQLTLGLAVVLPFAIWGMAATGFSAAYRREPDRMLLLGALLAYAASVIAFFISDRYRMPATPLLAIFAAAGAVHLREAARRPDRRVFTRALGGIVLAAIFATYPFELFRYADDGLDHVKLSDAFIGRGDHERALAECQRAADISPQLPDTLFCFATAYYFKKDYFRAEMALRATLDAQAGTYSDVPARRNLAHVLKEQKRFAEALAEAADDEQRRTIETEYEEFKRTAGDPRTYAATQLEEASRRRAAGDLFEARSALLRAVQADPRLPEAHFAIAEVSTTLGLPQEACPAARAAVDLAPHEPRYKAAVAAACAPR